MLIPQEWIENTVETYFYQQSKHTRLIYLSVLIAVTAALISLPFIYIDISVQAGGVVRPVAEKTEIKSPLTELVDSVFVNEGSVINKGDKILKFRTSHTDYKIDYQSGQLKDYQTHVSDLTFLAKGEKPVSFQSPARQQQYIYYNKRLNELETEIVQAEKEYNRNKLLYEKKVISEEEYDSYYFKLENKKNELASFKESQLATWQTDLNSYHSSYHEMNALMNQEIKNRDTYIIKSPVTGTIDQFTGIYVGSSLQAGQSIAVVSPDSTMYFETYVAPRDIGYIHVGMPVQVQVESFNYNDWGSISGSVTEISSDFFLDRNGTPYYKVKCSMERDYLSLKNGRIGKLKKGMTVNANFIITRRSLFSLLYQSVNDWVNPAQYQTETIYTDN